MNPVRRQRLILAGLVLAAAAIAATLLVFALQQNMTYLHTPSEAVEGRVPDSAFRLGGVVLEGSFQRTPGSLDVAFQVTDRVHNYPVRYSGILPDLFREGQSIIARGRIDNDVFQAEEVLAKHDETYMPPEVAEKMAQARAKTGLGTRNSELEKARATQESVTSPPRAEGAKAGADPLSPSPESRVPSPGSAASEPNP